MSLGSKNAPCTWLSMRATGTTSEPRRGHARRVRPCPRSRSGVAAWNAAECQVHAALQVLEVAARCGRVVVLTLVLVLAGLMELGSVVVCSLFSRLSDSIEARDQHAGAASLRPGVRHPSLLARNPFSLHLTYPTDFAYLSAGRGGKGVGVCEQRERFVARDRGLVERVCVVTSPETVLARPWSDLHAVCSGRTPVSTHEPDMCVSCRSGDVSWRANTRGACKVHTVLLKQSRRSHQYCGHTRI